jgi:hypothetical protein
MSRRVLGWRIGIVSVLLAVAAPLPALAGHCAPLCLSFVIGDARSLPWGSAWWQGRPDYNLANLLSDTEALLVPSTPVVVRIETIRRASLYASRDRTVAERLLSTLMTRARNAEQAGRPDALAFFDAAYAANTLYQIGAYDDVPEVRDRAARAKGLVRDGDPYELVKKSLALRPDDAGLQFGAALIASLRPENHPAYRDHSQKARAGARQDSLLVLNLRYIS